MHITLTAAAFQRYTETDVFTIEGLSVKAQRVLWQIQKWDAMGKGLNGCFATVERIARVLNMTRAMVKGYIARLHKKGYLAFIGIVDKGMMKLVARRLVLPTAPYVAAEPLVEPLTADRILSGEQSVELAPAHMRIGKVEKVSSAPAQKLRESTSFSLPQNSPTPDRTTQQDGPHRGIEKKEERIPLRADSSKILFQAPDPSIGSNVEKVETTTPVSHKGRDWLAELAELPCAKLIYTRFKSVSGDDAKRLVRLVKNKKVDARVIGYILHHFQYLHTDPGINEPEHPRTLAAFCKNFSHIHEHVLKSASEEIIAATKFEFNRFEIPGKQAVMRSMEQLKSNNCCADFDRWALSPVDDFHHRWCDLIFLSKAYAIPGKMLLADVSEENKEDILFSAFHNLDTAKGLCAEFGLDFKNTYGMSYDDLAITATARKLWLAAEQSRLLNPLAWTPTT